MKILKFFLLLSVTILTAWYFGTGHNDLPPLAKILYPTRGYWHAAEKSPFPIASKIQIPDLNESVTVSFDKLGIPHIKATTDHDLYYAQGYITALHRLWPMELRLRRVAGQMAEIKGASMLNQDRLERRKGTAYGARKTLKFLKDNRPETYNIIHAYVEGINAYVSNLSYKEYPIEYKLNNCEPKRWEDHYPLMLLTDYFYNSNDFHSGLLHSNTWLQAHNSSLDSLIFKEDTTIIGLESRALVKELGRINLLRDNDYVPSVHGNHFAISRDKANNGMIKLAFSKYGQLSHTATHYFIELESNNTSIMGGSIPGIPLVLFGASERHAWHLLPNSKSSMANWYNIHFYDNLKKEYHYDQNLLKTEFVVENIKVKDRLAFKDKVIYTHFGPVVYDSSFMKNSSHINLAVQWYGSQTSELFHAILLLSQGAGDIIKKECQPFRLPELNVILTDLNSAKELYLGKKNSLSNNLIFDGSLSSHDIGLSIDNHNLPNEVSTLSTLPYIAHTKEAVRAGEFKGGDIGLYRHQRLVDRLNAISLVRTEDVMHIQNDNFNYVASRFLPAVLNIVDEQLPSGTRAAELLALLKRWDYFNQPQMVTPTIFHIWWLNLRSSILEKYQLNSNQVQDLDDTIIVAYLLDNLTSDEIKRSLKSAFLETTKEIEEISKNNKDAHKWYRYKKSSFQNFSITDSDPSKVIPVGGCQQCINYSTQHHGAIAKVIFEMNKKDVKMWASVAGSQTSNFGNPYYLSFNRTWQQGKYYSISKMSKLAPKEIIKTVQLNP